MVAHKRSSFGLQAALGKLITFHNNNQVLIKNCCYGNGCSRHPASLPPSQQILLKLVENMCIIKNRVQKRN